MFKISLYDKEIYIKDEHCKLWDDEVSYKVLPELNIYVKITKNCNASCKFCTFKNCNKDKFNVQKFKEVMKELTSKVKIFKVSFTGGEPTLYLELLKECVEYVKNICDQVIISTNGLGLKEILKWDVHSIALSRHHYDDDKNNEILGFNAISTEELKELSKKYNLLNNDKIHLTCNLINGYIDSKEELNNYIKWAGNIPILDLGFVRLMKINNYSREKYVDIKDINQIRNTFNNKVYKYKDSCRCENYIHYDIESEKFIKIYTRESLKPDNTSQLVFDGENLTLGFDGDIIK